MSTQAASQELINDLVGNAHGNFARVQEILSAHPEIIDAKAAWGDVTRAALAGLFTAFAFHMPAYYLTWGRYPLLAGLLVLPLAMAAAGSPKLV